MGEPLHRDGFDERIRDNDFLLAQRGGVAVKRSLGVGLQDFAEARQAAEKFQRERVGGAGDFLLGQIGGRLIFEALADFVFELADDGIEQHGGFCLKLGGMNQFLIEKSGKQQAQQVLGDRGDDALGGQVFAVEMVDAAHARVGGEQLAGQLGDRVIHGASIGQRAEQGKFRRGQRCASAAMFLRPKFPAGNLKSTRVLDLFEVSRVEADDAPGDDQRDDQVNQPRRPLRDGVKFARAFLLVILVQPG